MAAVNWASDTEDDELRRLSPEEIEDIVNGIRFGVRHNPVLANILDIHRQKTRKKLQTVEIYPAKIPELKRVILQQFYSSVVACGEAVGVNAAQCIGEPTTQMTLNSVAPTEKIIIKDKNGDIKVVQIGEWIDGLLKRDPGSIKHIKKNRTEYLELKDPVLTPSPNKVGEFSWESITAITRHLPVGNLVNVVTRSGRSVTATRSKSLLVWQEDIKELVQVGGGDVQVGDLVPVICEFPKNENTFYTLNLRTILSPKEWVYGKEVVQIYNKWLTDTRKKRIGFWTGTLLDTVPYARGDSLIEVARLGVVKEGYIYPKKNITTVKSLIPENFPLDFEFGQIVGLYLAEGWATNTFVGISNNEKTIQDLVTQWCDRYHITYHIVVKESERFENSKSSDIKIHSVLVARWFKKWLGTGSANKKFPETVYNANDEFVRGVLDGYFAGDGTVNKRDNYLSISSASKELITGFGVLCSKFGIFGKQSGHQPIKNNVGTKIIKYVHTYSIRNNFAQVWADKIGSCHPLKFALMTEIINKKYAYPCGRYWRRQGSAILDPIVSIEEVPATEFVYDLTVPTTTNFSLWNGLGVADTFHSAGISAKNVTLGFPRAQELFNATRSPSNPTCTIYFTRDNETPEALHSIIDRLPEANIDSLLKGKGWEVFDPENYPLEYWHKVWLKIEPDFGELAEDDWCLRLQFDIERLYELDLTIKDIAERLEALYSDLRCIPSPLNVGILDIIVNCTDITITGQKTADLVIIDDDQEARDFYMRKIVAPRLRGQKIAGVSGVTKVYRRKAKPDECFGGFPLKEEIAARVTTDEEWIADTDGTNLSEILAVPGVDSYRTISNDVWEISSIFGIEASRMYLFTEFTNIVSSGGISINPVHIQVLVDKMCYTGGIRAIDRFGVETAQYGPISRATFEQVMDQIITSAMFSENDNLNGISSNIVLGTKINAGTGRVQFEEIPIKIVRPAQRCGDGVMPPVAPQIVSEDI